MSREIKILFICGSQEPGRDGVGDYVRRLATEVIKQGNKASVIAFNDNYISSVFKAYQDSRNGELEVLRLPAIMSYNERINEAKKWVTVFHPEWISLQFVAYSFDKKGLPFGLGKQLSKLGKNSRWHMMIHELWPGVTSNKNVKRILASSLQKILIKNIINQIKPQVIHTHLPNFSLKLSNLGFKAQPLPLFSNIELTRHIQTKDQRSFKMAFFSQAAASIPIINFVKIFSKQLFENGIKLQLLFIGGKKDSMEGIGKYFANIDNLESITYTGFLENDEISAAIQLCDMGITPIPRHALGKSGSVSAFFTHGVPVAAPVVDDELDPMDLGFFSVELKSAIIIEPDLVMFENAKNSVRRSGDLIQLSKIANTFLCDLVSSSKN